VTLLCSAAGARSVSHWNDLMYAARSLISARLSGIAGIG
jgi:hypothetical protein